MAHLDKDGEYILDTVEELREFIGISQCPECVEDATNVLGVVRGKAVSKVVFSMKCPHVKKG